MYSRLLVKKCRGGVRRWFSAGKTEGAVDQRITLSGLQRARQHDILIFDNGSKGLVLELMKDTVEAAALSKHRLPKGTEVEDLAAAEIRLTTDYLGAAIDPFGKPVFSKTGSQRSSHSETVQKKLFSRFENPRVRRWAGRTAASKGGAFRGQIVTGYTPVDALQPIPEGQATIVSGERGLGKRNFLFHTIHSFLKQQDQYTTLASRPVVVYAATGASNHATRTLLQGLEDAALRSSTVVVACDESASLAEQHLVPFTATQLATHYLSENRRVLLVIDSFSTHFDLTRRVHGITWNNAAAAPTRHGEILDLADYYTLPGHTKPSSSLTILGVSDLPASGDSSLTVDNKKQRGHTAQVASFASRHIKFSSVEARATALLPVTLSDLLATSSHYCQGTGFRYLSSMVRSFIQMAQETVVLANIAREYGQEPEAEMDAILDFNTKIYLLLTPTKQTLERAKRSRGVVASANIGLDRARDLASNIEVMGGGGSGVTATSRSDHGMSTTHSSSMVGMGKSRRSGPLRESIPKNTQEELQKLLEKRQQERSQHRAKVDARAQGQRHYVEPSEEVFSAASLDRAFTALMALVGGHVTKIPVSMLQEYVAGAVSILSSLPPVKPRPASDGPKYSSVLEEAIAAGLPQPLPTWPVLDVHAALRKQAGVFGLPSDVAPDSWKVCNYVLSSYSKAFAYSARKLNV